jgi:hypothetical protein
VLDSDSYLFQDPYKYLKAPPFKDKTWLALQDGGITINGAPTPAVPHPIFRAWGTADYPQLLACPCCTRLLLMACAWPGLVCCTAAATAAAAAASDK